MPSWAAAAPRSQDGGDGSAGGETAGSDEGLRDLGSDELQRGQQGEIAGLVLVDVGGAMAARFDTLHDERVGAEGVGEGGFVRRGDGQPDL